MEPPRSREAVVTAYTAIRSAVIDHGLADVRRALRLVTEEWDDGSDEPVERTEPRHKDWHRLAEEASRG